MFAKLIPDKGDQKVIRTPTLVSGEVAQALMQQHYPRTSGLVVFRDEDGDYLGAFRVALSRSYQYRVTPAVLNRSLSKQKG